MPSPYQVTTGEHHLHLAAADGAPGFENLVRDIVNEFAAPESDKEHALEPVLHDDANSDWDQLYPFSAVCHYFFPTNPERLMCSIVPDNIQGPAGGRPELRLAMGA
jgi:hypothetical protein